MVKPPQSVWTYYLVENRQVELVHPGREPEHASPLAQRHFSWGPLKGGKRKKKIHPKTKTTTKNLPWTKTGVCVGEGGHNVNIIHRTMAY
jgi:hypothetical protein